MDVLHGTWGSFAESYIDPGAKVGHPVCFERFNSLADFSRGLAKEVGCALMRFVMVQGISRSHCC